MTLNAGSVGASLVVWIISGVLAWTGARWEGPQIESSFGLINITRFFAHSFSGHPNLCYDSSFAELGAAIPLNGGAQAYLNVSLTSSPSGLTSTTSWLTSSLSILLIWKVLIRSSECLPLRLDCDRSSKAWLRCNHRYHFWRISSQSHLSCYFIFCRFESSRTRFGWDPRLEYQVDCLFDHSSSLPIECDLCQIGYENSDSNDCHEIDGWVSRFVVKKRKDQFSLTLDTSSSPLTPLKTALVAVPVLAIIQAARGKVPETSKHAFSSFSSLFEGSSSSPSAYALALYSGLWSFDGWDQSSYVAGEMKNVNRDLPRVIHSSLFIVLIVFLATVTSYFVVLPTSLVSKTNTVALDFGSATLGTAGGIVFASLVAFSWWVRSTKQDSDLDYWFVLLLILPLSSCFKASAPLMVNSTRLQDWF